MILLEKELNRLKQKHNENMQSAYANIIKSEAKNYKYEIEVILDYFGIDCGVESDLFEKQLEEIKNKYDINYRIITLSDDWYKNSMLPLLVRDGDLFKARFLLISVDSGFFRSCFAWEKSVEQHFYFL